MSVRKTDVENIGRRGAASELRESYLSDVPRIHGGGTGGVMATRESNVIKVGFSRSTVRAVFGSAERSENSLSLTS